MILVAGATGRLGRAVARQLAASGRPLRLGMRKPDGVRDAALSDAEVRRLDMRDPASIAAAVEGVETVFAAIHALMHPARDATRAIDVDGHLRLIDLSEQAGVRRFVYTSAMGAAPDHPAPLWRAKALIESRLASSAMDHVSLRPSAFMDLHAHDLIGASVLAGKPVRLFGDGRQRRNFVAVADVSAVAARAIAEGGSLGRLIDIGGPDTLTDREVADLYARLSGQPARIQALPPPALHVLSALISPFHAGIANIMRLPLQFARAPEPVFDASAMSGLLGREPISLESFARNAIEAPAA